MPPTVHVWGGQTWAICQGAIINTPPIQTVYDWDSCIDECNKNAQCVSFEYTNSTTGTQCVLKASQKMTSTYNMGAFVFYKMQGSAPVTTTTTYTSTTLSTTTRTTTKTTTSAAATSGLCYGGIAPKSTRTASNGDLYGICPGNDFYGGDMSDGRIQASDLNDCIDSCAQRSGCVSVAFEDNVCYLKSSIPPAQYKSTEDAAYKLSSASGSSSGTKVGSMPYY